MEEAALAGIPSIVIDPNNDLSRLGDPWPARPGSFTAEDDAKAQIYRERVEAVVWTPGVHAGNPLFLPVLPDFASLGDDKDERAGSKRRKRRELRGYWDSCSAMRHLES